MSGISPMVSKDLLCKEYKKNGRDFLYYRGFSLASLKLILEYSFSGAILSIERNHKKLQFDIYLRKDEVDLIEVDRFKSFYGPGFHIILLEESNDRDDD